MPYGEKYYHAYCDSFGIQCRVGIYEKDWEGGTTELEASGVPFTKEMSGSTDFKFEPIRPTKGTANLVFGTSNGVDLEEIWTADEKQYQLRHYVNSNLDWIGYVIPNGFAYEFKGGKYDAVMDASDGLGILKNVPFVGEDGLPYGLQHLVYNTGFQFPFILILTEILKKLELDLNTWVAVDLYEQSMVKTGDTRDAAPMANSYTSTKTFIDESEKRTAAYWKDANSAMSCEDVLRSLCIMYGAKVYQEKGVWKFKSIPVDRNYGTGATQRYWHKFNTASVYLGRETVDNEILVKCATVASAMIGNDHVMSMGEVYSAFRINYKYRFTREGDNPINLIKNADFSDWGFGPGPSNWGSLWEAKGPNDWLKWSYPGEWRQRARPIDISAAPVGGYTTAIQIGTNYPGVSTTNTDQTVKPWNSIKVNEITNPISVVKGDKLNLRIWVNWYQNVNGPGGPVYPTFRMILDPSELGQANYYLRNNPNDQEKGVKGFAWTNEGNQNMENSRHYVQFILAKEMAESSPGGAGAQWWLFDLDLADIPVSGKLSFEIMGLMYKGWTNVTRLSPRMKVYWPQGLDSERMRGVEPGEYLDNGGFIPRMMVTGIILSKIPEPSENAQVQDFIYDNPNPNYTLEIDPLEVLNGDVNDPQHVSRIVVQTNTTGNKNFWNTIDDEFEPASLGLIVVRRIMQQYIKPLRILEGAIKAQFVSFDTRFRFEALPGKIFGLLRGTINQKQNYLQDATFFEFNLDNIPIGGTEGGNSTEPVWIFTGNIRCEKDGSLRNTGKVQREIIDKNPNSQTYDQPFWDPFGGSYTDVLMCPIGEPNRYYWGTDDISYDTANFEYNGFIIDSNDNKLISCNFDNDGGEYIYFLHLASLSIVEGIFTVSQDEIISDFQYIANTTIDGYVYKVLRQNYVTSQFDNLEINFKFH